MKVAIIGAGAAGLAAARRALQYHVDITVFEMTNEIGGLWVYREESVCVGNDESTSVSNPILYSSLRCVSSTTGISLIYVYIHCNK